MYTRSFLIFCCWKIYINFIYLQFLGSDLLSADIAGDKVKAGWWVRLLTLSGMDAYLEAEKSAVTVFAPLDVAASSINYHNRQLLESGKFLVSFYLATAIFLN